MGPNFVLIANREHNYASVQELVIARVVDSKGRMQAKQILPIARAAGYDGSARNFRRLVAAAKRDYRRDHHRGRRPAVWNPGEYLVFDWTDLTTVQTSEKETRRHFGHLARQTYVGGTFNGLTVALQTNSPEELTNRMAAADVGFRAHSRMIDRLPVQQVGIRSRRTRLGASGSDMWTIW